MRPSRRCIDTVVRASLATGLASRWRRLVAGRDAGSATVETAILTPLLVMVLLFVVLCGRLPSAQLDLQAAAHGAARAASIARTEPAARAQAERTALDTLAARGVTCGQPGITIDTGGLRPGGVVTVTVTCVVPLSDLSLLAVPGSRTVTATSTSPIDQWRGKSLGFANSRTATLHGPVSGDRPAGSTMGGALSRP